MECRRCEGLMVEEWCCELEVEGYWLRCVNCGAILDRTIQRNQGVIPTFKRPATVAF